MLFQQTTVAHNHEDHAKHQSSVK